MYHVYRVVIKVHNYVHILCVCVYGLRQYMGVGMGVGVGAHGMCHRELWPR